MRKKPSKKSILKPDLSECLVERIFHGGSLRVVPLLHTLDPQQGCQRTGATTAAGFWVVRYAMLVKLENKKSDTLITALIKQTSKLPEELYKSLTWD